MVPECAAIVRDAFIGPACSHDARGRPITTLILVCRIERGIIAHLAFAALLLHWTVWIIEYFYVHYLIFSKI